MTDKLSDFLCSVLGSRCVRAISITLGWEPLPHQWSEEEVIPIVRIMKRTAQTWSACTSCSLLTSCRRGQGCLGWSREPLDNVCVSLLHVPLTVSPGHGHLFPSPSQELLTAGRTPAGGAFRGPSVSGKCSMTLLPPSLTYELNCQNETPGKTPLC